MKFPTDRPVKVVMLGAGGTGGYGIIDLPLTDRLYRYKVQWYEVK